MKTTRLYFIAFSIAFNYFTVNAQVIHNDPDPDIIMQMPTESYNNITLDIDGDNTDDIKFQYTNYPSFNLWNLGVVQPDTNMFTIEVMYDGSMSPSPVGDYYVKQLSANADISASGTYSNDYPQIGDIYYMNFNGSTGKYMGFRLNKGSDYKYGWMAIELTGSGSMTFTIKEFAFQNTVNTPIKAGQTVGVGIEYFDLQNGGLSLYPNPVNDVFTVTATDNNKIEQVRIYNLEGRNTGQWNKPVLPLKVETAGWNSGTYVVEIVSEGQVYREMIIKN